LENPDRELHGYEIGRLTGLPVATPYLILERQRERGRLTMRMEEADELETPHPLRKYYRLTREGEEFAKQVRIPLPEISNRRES
jgi:DNA-binding PadR family transcriptional regulator